jgi:pyruvate kinase
MPYPTAVASAETGAQELAAEARSTLDRLGRLRDEIVGEAELQLAGWDDRIARADWRPSAENLALYLALRRRDLRRLQLELMPLGLSSLGRCESRVRESLDTVLASLSRLVGRDDAPWPHPAGVDFYRGTERLRAETNAVFGPPPAGRDVRIMVTLGADAAASLDHVRDLVGRGMDAARINCAHDGPATWLAIAENVRLSSAELGRSCAICVDLTGPRARTGAILADEEPPRVHPGDAILLVGARVPIRRPDDPVVVGCSLPEVVSQIGPGDVVTVDEGALEAVVASREGERAVLHVVRAPDKGFRLRPDKGLNFPTSALRLDALTDADRRALDVVAGVADLIGYSFVQRPEDLDLLHRELDDRTDRRPAVIAKVETALAVQNLPELIVAGAGASPFAVMIARGDLAVEIGPSRLAEIQEELLWLCEAAHVPVVWATQVLDSLVKKGVHRRGELTDAAMAERAECVMLNKGAFVGEAVSLLGDVLGRMEGHQAKKTSRIRALRAW